MDFQELQKKEDKDLQQLLAQTRDKLRELRFKDANKQLKNVREIRSLRKEVAQILSILNSRKNK